MSREAIDPEATVGVTMRRTILEPTPETFRQRRLRQQYYDASIGDNEDDSTTAFTDVPGAHRIRGMGSTTAGTVQYSMGGGNQQEIRQANSDNRSLVIAELAPTTVEGTAILMEEQPPPATTSHQWSRAWKVFIALMLSAILASLVVIIVVLVFPSDDEVESSSPANTTTPEVTPTIPSPPTESPSIPSNPSLPTEVPKSPTTESPTTERPGALILEPLTTIDGNVGEQFGLVVSSVTGTGSVWVAVGGIDFVRVFRLEDDQFVQVGDDLTNNNKILFQVSLASNGRIATAWHQELTIHQFDSSDNKWKDVFTLDDFDSEDIISTAMSANGQRFVVGVLSPDSSSAVSPGSSSAEIDIYYRNGTDWELQHSFEVDNPDKQMIQLEISHTGESIVALASGRVVSYLFDGIWARDNIPAGGSNNVTALSGDGRVCAVANPFQMLTVIYDETSQGWESGPFTAEQGIHAMALDHSGRLLAVTVTELMDTKLGSVSVWYQATTGADYTSIQEIQGEMRSGFGTSVSMTNPDSHSVLVVGAPNDGKNAGRAHFYKIQEYGLG